MKKNIQNSSNNRKLHFWNETWFVGKEKSFFSFKINRQKSKIHVQHMQTHKQLTNYNTRETQTKNPKETVKIFENKKGKNEMKWEYREKENRNVNGESEKEKVSLDGKIIILEEKKSVHVSIFQLF